MNSIINIARYLCNRYKERSGEILDELKLHKLLYFAQRECIAITNEPMFSEIFKAWKFGPVNKEVRNAYKAGNLAVYMPKTVSDDNIYILNNIIEQYGVYTSWALSDMTHNEASWANARVGLKPDENGNNDMKIEDIYKDAEKVRPYDNLYDMYYDEFDDAGGVTE